jgi:hypothetical protein
MTLGTRSIAFVMFIFLKAKSHQLLVYWGHNDKLSSRAALCSTSLNIQSDQTDREQPLRGLLQRHVRFPFVFFLFINSDYNLSQLYTLLRII